jgi:DNA-directed RNA polymerase subunit RPC12/RpoP
MEHFESGTAVGAGSFRCDGCGFAMMLRERDVLPDCPGCGGRVFVRALLFGETVELDRADELAGADDEPDWLEDLRTTFDGPGAYLAFDDGDRIRTLELAQGWTRIGRSLSAELRIDDPTVSRRHALVHRDGDVVRLLDDRSLNGVFRNGRRVELDALDDGDTIAIGRFELCFLHLATDRAQVLAGA